MAAAIDDTHVLNPEGPLQMPLLKLTEVNGNLSNLNQSVTNLSIRTDDIVNDCRLLKTQRAYHCDVLDAHTTGLVHDQAQLSTSTEIFKLQQCDILPKHAIIDSSNMPTEKAATILGTAFSDRISLFDDDDDDDDEHCCTSNSLPKLQFRKDCLKARWNDKMGMAEVFEVKGQSLTTTGITRNGKVYLSIEETLFLTEVGALVLLNNDDKPLHLASLYEIIASGRHGCSWESFEAYRHLKALGYIVGRHGVPWSLKSIKSNGDTLSPPGILLESDAVLNGEFEAHSAMEQLKLKSMQINEARPLYDVYLPNSKFRKTAPGKPSFIICSTSGHPPSKVEIEAIERRSNGIPLKFCNIQHGRVSYFCFNKVDLPLLP